MTTAGNARSPAHRQSEIVAAFRNVTVAFDSYRVRALNDVSFPIWRGEILGVLGGSGSGKSVALRLLAGRLRPTDGVVKVFGAAPTRAGIRARIGYLAGRPAANSESASARWVRFFSAFKPRLENRADRKHSPGESRRAGLRQAVLGNRDLIILDDAFADLDSGGGREIKDLVRALAARGKTIVLGTRSLADALDVCDRLCFLHEGKLQAIGAFDELIARPEAVHYMAPVLPEDLAEQLLSVIRRKFKVKVGLKSPGEIHSAAALAGTSTGAETIPPPSETSSDLKDGVNHARLAALTKTSVRDTAAKDRAA